jgi:hypothetical protein
MSMSELMLIRARGDERFVGIPVFTPRRFYHAVMLVRKDAHIDRPADLKGKRVGVPEYVMTSALWTRGVHSSGPARAGLGQCDGASDGRVIAQQITEAFPERIEADAISY